MFKKYHISAFLFNTFVVFPLLSFYYAVAERVARSFGKENYAERYSTRYKNLDSMPITEAGYMSPIDMICGRRQKLRNQSLLYN